MAFPSNWISSVMCSDSMLLVILHLLCLSSDFPLVIYRALLYFIICFAIRVDL